MAVNSVEAINRQQYMPNLDGLRAVAVIFVMVYHTELGLLPGGFIGVDIFFVLSGFLITNQLSRAIESGQFRFRDFYLRRIRRLVPAYAAVSAATLGAGYFLLLPKDFVYHAKLTGMAFLSVGNFYIENTTGGYFATESAEIPLLHTWSLSVEEQFYLVWPALLLLLFKVRDSRVRLFLLGCGFCCFVCCSQWQALYQPSVAYYLLPARFAELLVGALLSLAIGRLPVLTTAVAGGLQLFGLGVLFAVAFLFGADTVFPGVNALLVSVATALVIYAGSIQGVVSSCLSIRPMVLVGQLSYSLYLWHWPVFAYWRYVEGELSVVDVGVALLLSLLLATLSWQYVEKPFRYRWRRSFGPSLGYLYLLPFAMILLAFLVIDGGEGLPQRFGERQAVIEAIESQPGVYQQKCEPQSVIGCTNVLLMGDSHAQHFGPFVRALAEPADGVFLTSEGSGFCPPLLGLVPIEVKDGGLTKKVNTVCEAKNVRLLADVSDYEYVVLAAYWAFPQIKPGRRFYAKTADGSLSLAASMTVLRSALFSTVQEIVDQGVTPVIVKDTPTITKTVLKCAYKQALYTRFDQACRIARSAAMEQRRLTAPVFETLAAHFPDLRFIDPLPLLCDEQHCDVLIDGVPVYRDRDHLNATGSKLLGEEYRALNGSPFLER